MPQGRTQPVLDISTPQKASAQLLTCGSLALPSIKPGSDAIPGAGGAAGVKGKVLGTQRPISICLSALLQLVGKGCPDLCVCLCVHMYVCVCACVCVCWLNVLEPQCRACEPAAPHPPGTAPYRHANPGVLPTPPPPCSLGVPAAPQANASSLVQRSLAGQSPRALRGLGTGNAQPPAPTQVAWRLGCSCSLWGPLPRR